MRLDPNVHFVSPTNKPPFDHELREVVHVWTAHLDGLEAADFTSLEACLDPEESARARRFYFERDQRHFTAARGWLRRLLSRYLNVSPGEVRFGYGARGKPFVDSPATSLRFNLSHSHGRAMFVFAHEREVGIDLEAGARLGDDWQGLVRRVFSQRETAELATFPSGRQREAFLNGWTRKEAYLKATGLGIVDGLQSIEVALGASARPELFAGPAGLEWTLHDLRCAEGFSAALVVESKAERRLVQLDCATHF